MRKESTAVKITLLILLMGLSTATAQFSLEQIHHLDKFRGFASTNEINARFAEAGVSITVLPLQEFKADNYVLTAYPYSGSDTIDVYSFVKRGDKWSIQMLYFALSPTERRFRVRETRDEIEIFDGDKKLVSIIPTRNK